MDRAKAGAQPPTTQYPPTPPTIPDRSRRRTTSPGMPVPCVYILASRRNDTRLVGGTSDLSRRIWEHKQDLVAGFTNRYRVHALVWLEVHGSMAVALSREKAIQEWRRAWKLALIAADNLEWRDLSEDVIRSTCRFGVLGSWAPAFAGVVIGGWCVLGWAPAFVGWNLGGAVSGGPGGATGFSVSEVWADKQKPPTLTRVHLGGVSRMYEARMSGQRQMARPDTLVRAQAGT